MENLLLKYMSKGMGEGEAMQPCGSAPVVTISREFGCPSKLIAYMLSEALNKRNVSGTTAKWHFLNKELLEESAKELELKPVDLNYLLSSIEKGLFEDILASFSQTYVNNFKIRKTLFKITRSIAQKGNVILVGRGGAVVLKGCPNSLHIRLQAPLGWRIQSVAQLKSISQQEALNLIVETDKKRKALFELLLGEKFDTTLFDLIFNCERFSKEEIVASIIRIMELKKMI